MSTPVLHLLAGPNGAGKSTLVAKVLQPVTHLPFVNADLIAAERWPKAEVEHAYEASRAAADERRRLMGARASFITETVFSHPSKVDLVAQATALGYLVHLHVVMVPESLPVARVTARDLADRVTFYDNSRAARPFIVVAAYERGRLVGEPGWPVWTPGVLLA